MRCTGKMAPPDENLVNAHSQHRQNFSSGPGTSSFWTLVVAFSSPKIEGDIDPSVKKLILPKWV